jgi:Na+-transporting NADH:ubiquinone oxidoreductase subunit C
MCAVVVSSSAYFLRAPQERNKLLDRQRQILSVAGLLESGTVLPPGEVRKLFDDSVEKAFVNLKTGKALTSDEFRSETGLDPATYDAREASTKSEFGRDAPEGNLARIPRLANYEIVYYIREEGQISEIILPINGKGLWSTLYGFLALDKDTRTVRGITFYEHGETAGLGGEIENPKWKALWKGRLVYDENWIPDITVIKGQAGPPEADPHEVDGLSGATITSRGVSNLVRFWLGEDGFKLFLEQFRNQGSAA